MFFIPWRRRRKRRVQIKEMGGMNEDSDFLSSPFFFSVKPSEIQHGQLEEYQRTKKKIQQKGVWWDDRDGWVECAHKNYKKKSRPRRGW